MRAVCVLLILSGFVLLGARIVWGAGEDVEQWEVVGIVVVVMATGGIVALATTRPEK